MKEFEIDPYKRIPRAEGAKDALLEIPYAFTHLRKIFKERQPLDPKEAMVWLNLAWKASPKNQETIFDSEKPPMFKRYLTSGFNASIFVFETSKGEWVLKIGAKISPSIGCFNPSSKNFADWYSYNLNVLDIIFGQRLPYLVPKPQEVLHATNEAKKSTTLIIQPYIKDAIDFRELDRLSPNVYSNISGEFNAFYALCAEMKATYGLWPDLPCFGRKGNLAVAQIDGHYHLVLLDNGLIDINTPSPIFNLVNRISYSLLMKQEEIRLRKRTKDSK